MRGKVRIFVLYPRGNPVFIIGTFIVFLDDDDDIVAELLQSLAYL